MKQQVATKLNFDTHYTLLDSRDIVYMMNGTTSGLEGSNYNLFAQNMMSNELCVSFPEGYDFCNGIKLDNFEYLVFFTNGTNSKIGLLNTKNCTYQDVVESECLGFNKNNPIRGTYKHLNKTNERVAYWVDGLNYDRYLNIDQALLGNFPKLVAPESSLCEDCEVIYLDELDCNQLRINKILTTPCIRVKSNKNGSLVTGTYQVGIAYSEDGQIMSDFAFSSVVKARSNKSDIGFKVSLSCGKNPFSSFTVILVTQTFEGSLIVYSLGEFTKGIKSLTINNISNATVISTSSALSKKVIYDKSQHLVSNGETLLRGKHQTADPLEYQLLANTIGVKWVERRVPVSKAHLFPNFMRDEVYDLAIEWKDEVDQVRGVYHIPGRPVGNTYEITLESITYHEDDPIPSTMYLYEGEECEETPAKIWEIENTAYITEQNILTCDPCEDNVVIGRKGKMGYYECKDLLYPDEPRWGDLACQPIRRHKFPSNKLTHIHGNGNCFPETTVTVTVDPDTDIETTTVQTFNKFTEAQCVHILGVELENVPLPPGVNPEDGWTFRLLYSKRDGNKSILHKGLIFNVMEEHTDSEVILYPNYPYNDLHPDVYLSTTQTNPSADSNANHNAPNNYSKTKFTYHSPEIHFKETQQEFGTELKLYTEQIGSIKGDFKETYRHPKLALSGDNPDIKTSWPYAQQFNSVSFYDTYYQLKPELEGANRRKIDYSQWLYPIKQFVRDGKKFNNDMRETSYYIELLDTKEVPNPYQVDASRFTRGDIGCRQSVNFCDEVLIAGESLPIQAVSYYAGIKVPQPNQYGQNSQITYVPVESCYKATDALSEVQFFGGDIYITRHSITRKMPIFSEWLYDVPYTTEYDYRDHRNVYYPVYWWDNLNQIADLNRLSCYSKDAGVDKSDLGYIYTWVTGNLYFFCESEFIGDFREQDATPNSRYYPNVDYNELTKADNIRLQQTFLYDFSLLKGSIEETRISGYTKSDADYTVSFSLKNDLQSAGDNWLKFLPLNYSILPPVYGDFTGMHYVDQYSIFFIFENEILYSQEDYSLQTNQSDSIFLGQGDIFSRRLRKIANEETGFAGSVDPRSFHNTRYGTFFYDRYRSVMLHWDGTLKPLDGMNSWLNNIPDNMNMNSYKNSIHTVYDNFTDRLFITDPVKKWTLSYAPAEQSFKSFHSFTPDFYLVMPNTYLSTNSKSFWKHNKGGYQMYYGEQFDFEVGFIEFNQQYGDLKDLKVWVEFIDQAGYGNTIYNKNKFFDQVLVYNNQGSTGIQSAFLKNPNDAKQTVLQNREVKGLLEVSNLGESVYLMNKFENNHAGEGLSTLSLKPNGMEYNVLNIVDKRPVDREEIKGRWFKIHLISRTNNTSKIILQLTNPDIAPLTKS